MVCIMEANVVNDRVHPVEHTNDCSFSSYGHVNSGQTLLERNKIEMMKHR